MLMKKISQLCQVVLGLVAYLCTTLITSYRQTSRALHHWWIKRSKWFRRSITSTLLIIPIGFVMLWVYEFYDTRYGRWEWNDRSLSKQVEVHGFHDCTFRIYNNLTEKYTTPKIQWVSDAINPDSLVVYALSDKRGYVNAHTGEIIIDALANNYQKAWVFSENLAAVMQEGKIGFINENNEVIIPFEYDYSEKCRIWNFGYLFHKGYCIMTDKEGNFGLIDSKGKWVVKPSYDEIWAPHTSGYRIVIDEGKYGLLDPFCQYVYPVEYEYIEIQSDSFILYKDGKKWQVDFRGNILHPFIFDASNYLNYPMGYNENGEIQYVLSDYEMYEVLNRYGILNRQTGQPVTPALYSGINMISEDLFEVRDPESFDWYILDKNGKTIMKKDTAAL